MIKNCYLSVSNHLPRKVIWYTWATLMNGIWYSIKNSLTRPKTHSVHLLISFQSRNSFNRRFCDVYVYFKGLIQQISAWQTADMWFTKISKAGAVLSNTLRFCCFFKFMTNAQIKDYSIFSKLRHMPQNFSTIKSPSPKIL